MQGKLVKTIKKHKKIIAVLAIIAALVTSAIILWQQRTAPIAEVVTFSTNQPSEEKPGNDFQWRGGPNDPKKFGFLA